MVHIAFAIDSSKKKEFKVLCAEHGDEMSAVLRKAINDYISSKRKYTIKS